MGVDEELVGVHCGLDVAGLHALVVGENLAAIALRVEEVLDHGVVGCGAGLVVWHGLHLLEHFFGEPLVADTAEGVDDGAVGDAGGTNVVGAHLGEVGEAVVDATGLAELADESVVQEGGGLDTLGYRRGGRS